MCIQRCAGEHVVESAVSVVDLPGDEMKGRIIGREGRNIRALEVATGCDLIIDDTPEAIIVSGFDPIRREIAKMSIEKLISDGRIHPARIEEVVEKVKKELDDKLSKDGEAAALEVGVHDLHPELIRMLGRLRYRTSYGQNVLNHSGSLFLAGMMAAEVHADVAVARRAGCCTTLAKRSTARWKAPHSAGRQAARKCGETEAVIHAMEAHHFDVEFCTLEAQFVQAADALRRRASRCAAGDSGNVRETAGETGDLADSLKGSPSVTRFKPDVNFASWWKATR
jgi:ribonuclease Y